MCYHVRKQISPKTMRGMCTHCYIHLRLHVRATLMMKPQPKDTQGDKGQYENNVQLVQFLSSVYTSANDKYMETCLVQWISSEIKLRRSHHTRRNPKPYAVAYYIIRTNKGKGNINENPDTAPLQGTSKT